MKVVCKPWVLCKDWWFIVSLVSTTFSAILSTPCPECASRTKRKTRTIGISTKILAPANFFQGGTVGCADFPSCCEGYVFSKSLLVFFLLSLGPKCPLLLCSLVISSWFGPRVQVFLRWVYLLLSSCVASYSVPREGWAQNSGVVYGWVLYERTRIPCIWNDTLSSFTTFSHHFTWGADLCCSRSFHTLYNLWEG